MVAVQLAGVSGCFQVILEEMPISLAVLCVHKIIIFLETYVVPR